MNNGNGNGNGAKIDIQIQQGQGGDAQKGGDTPVILDQDQKVGPQIMIPIDDDDQKKKQQMQAPGGMSKTEKMFTFGSMAVLMLLGGPMLGAALGASLAGGPFLTAGYALLGAVGGAFLAKKGIQSLHEKMFPEEEKKNDPQNKKQMPGKQQQTPGKQQQSPQQENSRRAQQQVESAIEMQNMRLSHEGGGSNIVAHQGQNVEKKKSPPRK